MKKILYISYDGLTDPLGQSQIIPYLEGLSQYEYQFTILSFEKTERFKKEEQNIRQLLQPDRINWNPLSFTRNPPLLAKFYDAIRMKRAAIVLHRKYKFDMVHCRSYIAADVGLVLKKRFGIKFLFDMRGFWADEKKDGGSWNLNNPIFKRVYRYYKKKETAYLQNADQVISLTEAGKKEMMNWPVYSHEIPIDVIPCCADMDLFSLTDKEQKKQACKLLNIEEGRLVISYLGSVGAWYMLDEMLEAFRYIKTRYSSALFLFITHSSPEIIFKKLTAHSLYSEDVKIIEAKRNEVPVFVKASDINISFIKPVYSKISSSPTKLGEVLSMGIPVISNAGVGDVEEIVIETTSGLVIRDFNKEEYERIVKEIPRLLSLDPSQIRTRIQSICSLQKGIQLYKNSYDKIFSS